LEDKVASLQARNEQAASENDNLKDLLARLQRENMMLKGTTFTFSVPERAVTTAIDQTGSSQIFTPSPSIPLESPLTQFDSISSTSSPPAPTPTQDAMFTNDSFDWNSLMSFDPAVLNLLDDGTQLTTTDATTIPVDYGLAGPLSPKLPYMTIANNPGFMSFADAFDGSSPLIPVTDANSFGYDIPSWPTPSQTTQEPRPLDEMFNGNYLTQPVGFGFGVGSTSANISPVLHTKARPNPSSSSNSSSDAQSLFSQMRESSASISDEDQAVMPKACPKSTEEFRRHIDASGPSPFVSAPPPPPVVRKSSDEHSGTVIGCQGAVLPKTEKSDKNIEVLTAWRDIMSMFKVGATYPSVESQVLNAPLQDTDMATLCAEFTSKAKCDGEKVVLEPQGVNHIVEKLRKGQSATL
jgi:AP-1-like factor